MASTSKKTAANPPAVYTVGDTVLGKIKGYPPWPGVIMDPDVVPKSVSKERPKSQRTKFYVVRFYPAGDFAWLVAKDISKLQTHEMEAYVNEPSKKSGELLTAYKTALDPSDWEQEQARKQKAKDEAEVNAPVDELDDEGEDDEDDGSVTGKKRKRASEGGKKGKAVAATPKKKASAKETPVKAKKGRGRKSGVQSAPEIVESEDEDADKKDDSRPNKRAKEPEDTPEAAQVKGWRHELQRTFLPKNGQIKADELPKASETLKEVEDYTPQLTLELFQSSKIAKVVKKVATLLPSQIPNGDEFKILERTAVLVDLWKHVLGPSSAPADSAAAPEPNAESAPAPTNGDVAMAEGDAAPAPTTATTNGDATTEDEVPKPATEEEKPMDVDAPGVEPDAIAEPEPPVAAAVEPESAPAPEADAAPVVAAEAPVAPDTEMTNGETVTA